MKKLFFTILFLTTVAILFVIADLYQKREKANLDIVYDNIHKSLLQSLVAEKSLSLSLALAISKNRALAESILERDSSKCHEILHETTDSFIKHLNQKFIYTQVITPKLEIFARSWDRESMLPIKTEREDLKELLRTKTPKASVSVSVPAGIKASAPIVYNGYIVGIMEVTTLLDRIVSKLRSYKIETIPLIKSDYVQKEDFIYKNPQIHGYKIANRNFNIHISRQLESTDKKSFDTLLKEQYLKIGDYFVASYPIRDYEGNKLGYFIAFITLKNLDNYLSNKKSILKSIFTMESTKEDIYNFVINSRENPYKEADIGFFLKMHDNIEEKDRIFLREAAKKNLEKLSKKELIDIILNRYDNSKKEGKIE